MKHLTEILAKAFLQFKERLICGLGCLGLSFQDKTGVGFSFYKRKYRTFPAVSDDKSEPNASSISAKVIVFVPSL